MNPTPPNFIYIWAGLSLGQVSVWVHGSLVALHILAYHHNVVGRQLVLNYMQTPPTQYFLEFSGQAAIMETHPNNIDRMCNRLPPTNSLTFHTILSIT